MNFHHHGHFGGGATPLLENLATQQRMKMDFLSPRGLAATTSKARDSPPKLLVKGWVLTRFFVDNKNDKTAWPHEDVSVSAATTPTPKPTGVTAA
ncbi:hypothetical protein GQ600_22886 [Phytophthora cactorum]|nr:hypothetical protein GQ600_22886 [Phytophthora cactorum]